MDIDDEKLRFISLEEMLIKEGYSGLEAERLAQYVVPLVNAAPLEADKSVPVQVRMDDSVAKAKKQLLERARKAKKEGVVVDALEEEIKATLTKRFPEGN